MNKIKQEYVTFEQAKWLKEKGFKIKTSCYYFEDGEFREFEIEDTVGMDYGSTFTIEHSQFFNNWNDNFLTRKNGDRCFGCSKTSGYLETYSSPEQHQVVEWIRVKHGIWINIKSDCYGEQWYYTLDVCSKDVWDNLEIRNKIIASIQFSFITAKSPQETTSEALDYIRLNNLI